jgi:hypothetical protein
MPTVVSVVMSIRKSSALLVLFVMIGACMPLGGSSAPAEGPQPCPALAAQLPQSAPALGGYDAGPGPKIGESQPIMVSYPASCMPAGVTWWW